MFENNGTGSWLDCPEWCEHAGQPLHLPDAFADTNQAVMDHEQTLTVTDELVIIRRQEQWRAASGVVVRDFFEVVVNELTFEITPELARALSAAFAEAADHMESR